jgi:hypothetical protein
VFGYLGCGLARDQGVGCIPQSAGPHVLFKLIDRKIDGGKGPFALCPILNAPGEVTAHHPMCLGRQKSLSLLARLIHQSVNAWQHHSPKSRAETSERDCSSSST